MQKIREQIIILIANSLLFLHNGYKPKNCQCVYCKKNQTSSYEFVNYKHPKEHPVYDEYDNEYDFT